MVFNITPLNKDGSLPGPNTSISMWHDDLSYNTKFDTFALITTSIKNSAHYNLRRLGINYLKVELYRLKRLAKAETEQFNMASVVDGSVCRDDTCDKTVVDSPPAKAAASTTFRLLDLPTELRAMIYESLIKAGDLSILRVSKDVSQEVAPLLSRVAIFRLAVGPIIGDDEHLSLNALITLTSTFTLTAPAYIQNLKIRVDLIPDRGDFVHRRHIWFFSGSQIARRSCNITIRYGVLGATYEPLEMFDMNQAIAALTGFKELTLKLGIMGGYQVLTADYKSNCGAGDAFEEGV